jgi:hypothetical protein
MSDNKPGAKRAPPAERAARLAAELRANLTRRKAQARARQEANDIESADQPGGSDQARKHRSPAERQPESSAGEPAVSRPGHRSLARGS